LNSAGPVLLEVTASNGERLGISKMKEDKIRNKVDFDGKNLREITKGNPARLHFIILDGGHLYSFTVNN
jgi:hypothetical protein